jgi:hypothetical protein
MAVDDAPESFKANGSKLSASAIQIGPVDAGDVWIPIEFRAATSIWSCDCKSLESFTKSFEAAIVRLSACPTCLHCTPQ